MSDINGAARIYPLTGRPFVPQPRVSDMTLHDLYAGLAMCALLQRKDCRDDDNELIAEFAMEVADAMLEAQGYHQS